MSYRTRKLLSLIILVIGLPLYIIAAMYVISLFDRPSFVLEIVIYVMLGFLWALPFRSVFRGVGKPDPDSEVQQPPKA